MPIMHATPGVQLVSTADKVSKTDCGGYLLGVTSTTLARHSMTQHSTTQQSTSWHRMAWHNMAQHSTA